MTAARTLRIAILALTFLALASAPALTEEEEEAPAIKPAAVIAQMTWLAGTWQGPAWGGTFVAYYSTPEGGRILSHSKLMKNDAVAFHEFEVFEPREETVFLQPYPGGKPAAGFTLAEASKKERKAVFDNPKNEYPTRITYHRISDERLVITLSDPHRKSGKVETFDLKRVD
jgi:hypothetical protein